jgi:hypothetical protein
VTTTLPVPASCVANFTSAARTNSEALPYPNSSAARCALNHTSSDTRTFRSGVPLLGIRAGLVRRSSQGDALRVRSPGRREGADDLALQGREDIALDGPVNPVVPNDRHLGLLASRCTHTLRRVGTPVKQHAVYDLAENPPPVAAGPYNTREQAQAAADQLNNPLRPATQDALLNDKEVAN